MAALNCSPESHCSTFIIIVVLFTLKSGNEKAQGAGGQVIEELKKKPKTMGWGTHPRRGRVGSKQS